MKAVLMTASGEADVLQVSETTDPGPLKETDVLVRLKAAGINPIDAKLRQRGTFYPDRTPAILGCDGAGIVESVGRTVNKFRPGDEVYFCNGGIGGHPGNYAEWAIVDEAFAARKPASISFTEAAAAPLILITAWEALYDRARLQPGQRALIHAGTGGVGHVAIQLAKLQGASVCTTVSTPEKARFARSLGADNTILYKDTDFVEATLDWTNGQGVDVAFDTVGSNTLSQSFAATQIYGDIVTILEPAASTNWKIARTRNQRISLELMLTPMLQGLVDEQKAQTKILEQCTRLIDKGELTIHVSQTFPLAQAANAHRTLEAGGFIGKLVLLTDKSS